MCFMRDPHDPPVLKIAGKELEVVTETKLLGLTVQSNLSWDMQVDSMVGKISRRHQWTVMPFNFWLEEEIQRLQMVFQHLRKSNLKLKPKKCSQLKPKVLYLGHVVTEARISTEPERFK